jgi:serine/threonine protein phosphatase PrpC
MNRYIAILVISILGSSAYGQSISRADSLLLMEALENVFKSFESPDRAEFERISSDEIFCLVCDGLDLPVQSFSINRESFFDDHLRNISVSDVWKRASRSKEIMLHEQKVGTTSIMIVFLTSWKRDELAVGHEGAQLGIHFSKVDGEYKFAGIETVP